MLRVSDGIGACVVEYVAAAELAERMVAVELAESVDQKGNCEAIPTRRTGNENHQEKGVLVLAVVVEDL